MARLLLTMLLVVAIVAGVSGASAEERGFWDKILYPSSATHPEHEITLQNTWGWNGAGRKFDGFIITISDLEKFARFHLEFAASDSYHLSTKEKSIHVPDGVGLVIDGIGTLDVSGAEVGSIKTVTTRKDFYILPALSIPIFTWNTKFPVRQGLQLKVESRVGAGYEVRAYIEESTFTVKLLDPEGGEGETISLPYTNSGADDGVAFQKILVFDIGFIHTEQTLTYSYPKTLRFTTGIGARW